LRNLLQALRDTYCRHIVRVHVISERAQRQWIQERIEPVRACELPARAEEAMLQKVTGRGSSSVTYIPATLGQKRSRWRAARA